VRFRSPGPWIVPPIVGGAAALVGYAAAAVFLVVAGDGAIGTTEPFTTLTATDGVSPVVATGWTFLDMHYVSPSVPVDSWGGFVVWDSVFGEFDGSDVLVHAVPVVLLLAAGMVSTVLARRRRLGDVAAAGRFEGYSEFDGPAVALGYGPLVAATALLRSPVAPDASGMVRIAPYSFEAATLTGVTAGTGPLETVVVAVVYPIVFGGVGAWLVGVCLLVWPRLADWAPVAE
jgi:hypothetical protein